MSPSPMSTRLLSTSRDGDTTASLGSPFQCSTTLSLKKSFLIFNLNLHWHNKFRWSCTSRNPNITSVFFPDCPKWELLSDKKKKQPLQDWGVMIYSISDFSSVWHSTEDTGVHLFVWTNAKRIPSHQVECCHLLMTCLTYCAHKDM